MLKRHYLLGDQQSPYLVPQPLAEQHPQWKQVKSLYQNAPQSHQLSLTSSLYGIDIEAISELILYIDEKYQGSFSHIPEQLWRDGLAHRDFRTLSYYNQQQDILELTQFRKKKKIQ